MTTVWTRTFMQEFISLYQKEETLWKMNSPWYRNKAARQEACERILVRVQEHMPKATVDTIVRKLKHLRTSFCKQKKMINDSIKAGATGDKVYKPKAWWYYALLFVNNQEDDNVTVPRSQHSENSNTKDHHSSDDFHDYKVEVNFEEPTREDPHDRVTGTTLIPPDLDGSDPESVDDVEPPHPGQPSASASATRPGHTSPRDRDRSTGTVHRGAQLPANDHRNRSSSSSSSSQTLANPGPGRHTASGRPHRQTQRASKRKIPEDDLDSFDLDPLADRDGDRFERAEHNHARQDSLTLFGQYVARCLGEMSEEQNTHAQKLMFDVMYEGKLGNLSRQTRLISGN